MFKLRIYFIVPILILLLNACRLSGQIIKGQTILNQRDKNWLKTGHWLEYDTIAKINRTLYSIQGEKRSPNDDVSHNQTKLDTVISIIKKEGNYRLGKPEGVWSYKIRDTLKREITYQEGRIVKAKIYLDGKLQYSGYTNNADDTFIYEQFDSRNKKVGSGSVPLDLMQIESNNRIDF